MSPDPTKIPDALKPLAQELLDNSYARDNLQQGAEKLREAYERSRKRRVKPATDRKLRKQVEAAIAALDEGTAALAGGRRGPKRTGRKVVLTVIGLAVAGAAAVLATNEDLRNQVLGSAKALGEGIAGDQGENGNAAAG